MMYQVIHTDHEENELSTEIKCHKVLVRDGAALFVTSSNEVTLVIPMDRVIQIQEI